MNNQEKQNEITVDLGGGPLMTPETIRAYCVADGLPEQPELNDKLYLYEKGFRKILSLHSYHNLISLWLNKNKIAKIQNLDGLRNLMCLYLQDNQITKIEGLDTLTQLEILNLEKNHIAKVENLGKLAKLKNLNLAQNRLSNSDSIVELELLQILTTLDLSKNEIENTEEVVKIMKKLNRMSCLCLKATPLARGFKNYRKYLIAWLPHLKFLDDRPVQQAEHRLCQAWATGGFEQEKKLRSKIKEEQQQLKKRVQIENQEQGSYKSQTFNWQQKASHNLSEAVLPESKKTIKNLQNQDKIDAAEPNKNSNQIAEDKLEDQLIHPNAESQKEKVHPAWNSHFERILEALLEKYEFDFSQVQPRFNMIVAEINKKLGRPTSRFQIEEVEKIWTGLEIRKRKENPLL